MAVLKVSRSHPSSFSFSVSKKVEKTASRRNLFRRRGYALIRKFLPEIKPGFFVVFIFKKSAVAENIKKLESEIKNLLEKSDLLIPSSKTKLRSR